ncbi:hypothetical protein BDF21DRAFT_38655 [Thamnidium elegans]|nr:hypothetical protein BDF21DRAFT_38655 [Thamnidium elegans]
MDIIVLPFFLLQQSLLFFYSLPLLPHPFHVIIAQIGQNQFIGYMMILRPFFFFFFFFFFTYYLFFFFLFIYTFTSLYTQKTNLNGNNKLNLLNGT